MSAPHESPNLPSQILAEKTHLRLPSLPHWIEPAVEYLKLKAVLAGACQETRAGKLLVALQEALANAVIHGNLDISSELKERGDDAFARALATRSADPAYSERMVDIEVDYDGSRCQWTITDQGKGFDVDAILARSVDSDPEILLASGRGILMMRSFMDEVRYELGGRRLILTLKQTSGEERRTHARQPTHQVVRVVPLSADGSVDWTCAYDAVSRDLSDRGVGLLQDRLARSESVLIGLAGTDPMVYVPARVCHSRVHSTDMVELGCHFLREQNSTEEHVPVEEAIERLLERRDASPLATDERRQHPRLVYNERIEIHREGGTAIVGYARDLSKGGLAIIATETVPLSIVVVLLPRAGGPALRIRAEVVRCDKIKEGFFDIGARFLQIDAV